MRLYFANNSQVSCLPFWLSCQTLGVSMFEYFGMPNPTSSILHFLVLKCNLYLPQSSGRNSIPRCLDAVFEGRLNRPFFLIAKYHFFLAPYSKVRCTSEWYVTNKLFFCVSLNRVSNVWFRCKGRTQMGFDYADDVRRTFHYMHQEASHGARSNENVSIRVKL